MIFALGLIPLVILLGAIAIMVAIGIVMMLKGGLDAIFGYGGNVSKYFSKRSAGTLNLTFEDLQKIVYENISPHVTDLFKKYDVKNGYWSGIGGSASKTYDRLLSSIAGRLATGQPPYLRSKNRWGVAAFEKDGDALMLVDLCEDGEFIVLTPWNHLAFSTYSPIKLKHSLEGLLIAALKSHEREVGASRQAEEIRKIKEEKDERKKAATLDAWREKMK